jgi:N-acetylglutamate synthase-like GNAT family acetyltransferase
MLIRKAVQAEVSVIWRVCNLAISAQCRNSYADDVIEKWIAGAPTEKFIADIEKNVWVADVDGEVVGFGKLNLTTGVVEAIFVHPDSMGTGVGTKMMAHLERQAADYGLTELTLNSSLNAAPFYRLCGFQGDQIGQHHSPSGVEPIYFE